jgi:hypothetical protein
MFFGDRSNYIGRGYSALLNNSHIGVLRLGNEFVKSFIDPDKGYMHHKTGRVNKVALSFLIIIT